MDDQSIVELYRQHSERSAAETSSKYGQYCLQSRTHILANREAAKESVHDAGLSAWNGLPPHRLPFYRHF